MALHDFRCHRCGYTARDVNIPVAVGAMHARIPCPTCTIGQAPFTTRPVLLDWIPAIGRVDVFSDGQFQKFAIEESVRGATVRTEIDSLHKLRQVERDSEQLARNGEGRPLVWRDYANARTNFDVHTLSATPGDPHGVQAVLAKKKHAVRKGDAVTSVHGKVD